jgi:hypothetical protein
MSISLSNLIGNGPAFSATNSAQLALSNAAVTLAPFDTVAFNENNNYNNSAGQYKFTPTVPGYYQINALILILASSADGNVASCLLFKNGSPILYNLSQNGVGYFYTATPTLSTLVKMDGISDYIQIYAQASSVSNTSILKVTSYFNAYLARPL